MLHKQHADTIVPLLCRTMHCDPPVTVSSGTVTRKDSSSSLRNVELPDLRALTSRIIAHQCFPIAGMCRGMKNSADHTAARDGTSLSAGKVAHFCSATQTRLSSRKTEDAAPTAPLGSSVAEATASKADMERVVSCVGCSPFHQALVQEAVLRHRQRQVVRQLAASFSAARGIHLCRAAARERHPLRLHRQNQN